jgi:hypothetical protein
MRTSTAYWERDGGIPNAVFDQIKDWTQEHCGFLPAFNAGGE